jgi:hypothetical protein
MAFQVVDCDNIRESFASSGATITLGGAVGTSRAFSAKLSSGDTFCGTARRGAEYSTGLFTYTSGSPGSIAQTDVWQSSNSNAAVSFAAGVGGEVFIDPPARLFDNLNFLPITVTSAATFDIGAAQGVRINASGTTGPVTSFGTSKNKFRIVKWAGATLTCNTTSLILIGLANAATRVTVSGDIGMYTSDNSGNWTEVFYQRASGFALVAPSVVPPQGRLTLQTLTPVMITTQSAKTTIYYTPFVGNQIPIYDGTNMIPTAFTEISVLTTDTTKNPAAIGASKVNDWFVWNDAGTLRLTHGPDWTNDTTRSAGTATVVVNGIPLNNASITNGPAAQRGTWVGTTRSNSSSQLNWIRGGSDTAGDLAVWNAYNRRLVSITSADTTATWSYTSATVRQARASANNQISFVSGAAEDDIIADIMTMFNLLSATTANATIGLAMDSITAMDKFINPNRTNQAGTITNCGTVTKKYAPQLGYHYVAALEAGDGTNATTFIGDPTRQGISLTTMM